MSSFDEAIDAATARETAYARNDDYAVDTAPYLGAARAMAGTILRRHGSFNKRTGTFTTGILLRSDFAESRVGNAWVMDGITIDTVVHGYERKKFTAKTLGTPEDDRPLYVTSVQVANRAAGMKNEDDWQYSSQPAGRHTLTVATRPLPTFAATTIDDHVFTLMPALEQAPHGRAYSPIVTGAPRELHAAQEAAGAIENLQTLACLVGELTMPLAAVAKDPQIRSLWQ